MDNQYKKGSYFNLKGKNAEEIINILAQNTFLKDWCFLNPNYSDGKELCDLLIVFNDIAIIFQIKSLSVRKDGFYPLNKKEKIFKQIIGAKKKLVTSKKIIKLYNSRQGEVTFDPKNIKAYFQIAIFYGDDEDYMEFERDYADYHIHVFNKNFTNIIFQELDTIRDFTDYLEQKEKIFKSKTSIIIEGGEENLLGYYIENHRSFKKFIKYDNIFLTGGYWENIKKHHQYIQKKKDDQPSYLWDFLIEKVYDCKNPFYEIVAREMAKLTRFERRGISNTFIQANFMAQSYGPQTQFKRIGAVGGTTYCFLFQKDDLPREYRMKTLEAICYIARAKFPKNKKVVGIATESDIKEMSSYDFGYYQRQRLTKSYLEEVQKIQDETKLLTNIFVTHMKDKEYR